MQDGINSVPWLESLGSFVQRAALSLNNSQIPACALSCITSRCAITNTPCICAHNGYRSDMTGCMFTSCGLKDASFSRNLTSLLCNEPPRDKSLSFKIINFLLGGLALGLVTLRIIHKRYFSATKSLGPDDWTILVAILIGIASVMLQVFLLTPNGLGQDIWKLDVSHLLAFGHYFYLMEILYLLLITLIKTSLSLFYLSIFPGRGIRNLLWITVVFHLAFGFAFIVKTILQCTPVSFNWEKFDGDPATTGHCIDMNASGWANGVLGVVADIWLFALPLTQIQKLRLHWKKKIGAGIMFLTGGIVTIVSLLRLKSVLHFANSYNPTWDHWGIVFWSTIEVSTGFVCCCLPALRLIFMQLFPRLFDTSASRSSTSCTPSLDRCRRKSLSHITDYNELTDNDYRDCSRASLVAAHHPLDQVGGHGDLEGGTGPVRIRPMQRMPSERDCIELADKNPDAKTYPRA